jgi:transposase
MKALVLKQSLGVDISKDDFKVCFSVYGPTMEIVTKGSHTFKNSDKGFAIFEEWLQSKRQTEGALHVTMEATGVYYEGLAYYLSERNYHVHIVLPNQAKSYGASLGIKSKTDKIDAHTLSRMGLERHLRVWTPFSSNFRILKQLTRERDRLIREKTRVSNHKHAYNHQGKPYQQSISRCAEHISFLKECIKAIDEEIKAIVESDASLKKKLEYVQSIPGVGLLTAIIIVAETNGFAIITGIKQLTSYAGLDIRIKESGKWKGQSKISKRGNSYIRKALYMPTLCKISRDEATVEFYERLKAIKGIGMIANVAVQRKLLGLIYTLWKKEEMFSPEKAKTTTADEKVKTMADEAKTTADKKVKTTTDKAKTTADKTADKKTKTTIDKAKKGGKQEKKKK